MRAQRSGRLAAVAMIVLVAACSSEPLPPPSGSASPAPSGGPSGAPSGAPSDAPSPQASGTSAPIYGYLFPEPPIEPSESVPAFPGLYVTPDIAVVGDGTYAKIISAIDCAGTRAQLSAGDWTLAAELDLIPPGSEAAASLGGAHWMLLRRGGDQALVKLYGDAQCSGSIEPVAASRFVVSGAQTVDADAKILPFYCFEASDGLVWIREFYDIDGGWLGQTEFYVVPTVGSHDLDATMLGSVSESLAHPGRPLFAAWASAPPDDGGSDLALGESFAGRVVVDSVDPISGTVEMRGLESAAGPVDLAAGFACRVAPFRGPKPAPIAEQQAISLSVVAVLDSEAFGISADSTVDLAGVLQAVTVRRYEGLFTATGSGSYTELDLSDPDFTRNCTGVWSGTQPIHVAGEVSPDLLRLSFSPAGPPSVTYQEECNVDSHSTDTTLPWVSTLRKQLDVAWPPGTPATDQQTIEVAIPDLGQDTWTVTFTSAP